jgi:hypothetical protein
MRATSLARLLILSLPLALAQAEGLGRIAADTAPDRWEGLKAAWALDHLAFAEKLLKRSCPGFADAQAGLAGQLIGPEDPGVLAYEARRLQTKPPSTSWLESAWREYERERGALHKRHAAGAAALLVPETSPETVPEIEAWALRLDPDQPQVRARRGEVRIQGLGWLPKEMADSLKQGTVLREGRWVKPSSLGALTSWEKAYALPTEHFLLKSTLPREKTVEFAGDLESLWGLWREMYEGFHPLEPLFEKAGRPLLVWLLQDQGNHEACYRANAKLPIAGGKLPVGAADADGLQAFFNTDVRPGSTQTVRGTLFHEGAHLIHYLFQTHSAPRGRGSWCVEGGAILMEGLHAAKSADWNASAGTATHRLAQDPFFMKVLNDLPASLLELDQVAFGAGGPGDPMARYCQAFALAHYLMYAQGGWHRRGFLEGLYRIHHDKRCAFEDCFPGLDPEDILPQAKAYAKSMR